MLDIDMCQCGNFYYIDEGETCMACSVKLCSDCARQQGFWFFDVLGGTIFVCKGCITEYKEKGIDWLKGELCEEFQEEVFLDALRKFESRENKKETVDQVMVTNRGQRLAARYAAKYICDRKNRDVDKITDEVLTDCFKGCVVTPKPEWYPYIRTEICRKINEAHGEPMGAELE